jgi:uncharacterized protein YjbJ (UPF0337 family)
MSDNNNQPSTIGGYVDQAIGAAQQALGSLTGNVADQAKGEKREASGKDEQTLSETAAKAGPFTLSSSGAVAADNPDRTAGSWNQTVGAAKEAVGGLIGSESLKQAGIQQNKEGKAQEASGQLNDLGSGISDRVTGAVGGAVAGLTGDKVEQEKRQQQHDYGKSLQRGVEVDLQKQAEALEKKKQQEGQ